MKKSWITLFVLFLVVLSVAAVVAAQDSASEPSGTVRVGTWESGAALIPWNNAIASYEAANPSVTIQFEPVPQDYGTKLLAQLASGDAPDIFLSGDGDVAKWVSLGAVENLDPYIDGPNGFDRSIMLPGVASFGDVQGSTYYLTNNYSPLVLFYNSDQFAEAGVDMPTAEWTLDDMLQAALVLTLDTNGNNATSPDFDSTNIDRWGLQIPNTWGDTAWARGVMPIIYANGGSLVAPDGSTTDGYMNSEATISALEWYVDLFETHYVAPTKTDVAAFSGTDLFTDGRVSMMWSGIWNLASYREGDSALTFDYGTMSLPAGSAGNANVLCWAGFALNASSENKDTAWDFLSYIAAGEGQNEFAQYGLTAVASILESQGLTTDQYSGPIVAGLDAVTPIPEATTPYWGECGDSQFAQNMATVLEGDTSVSDAMNAASAAADECLARKVAEEGR